MVASMTRKFRVDVSGTTQETPFRRALRERPRTTVVTEPPLSFAEVTDFFNEGTIEKLRETGLSLLAHRQQIIDEQRAKGVTKRADGLLPDHVVRVIACEKCGYMTLGTYGVRGGTLIVRPCDYCAQKDEWRTVEEIGRTT